jgi:hypothetical protein
MYGVAEPSNTPKSDEASPQGGESPPSVVRKVTVNFAPESYDVLSSVAKARNVSMSEALRQAIGLMALSTAMDR